MNRRPYLLLLVLSLLPGAAFAHSGHDDGGLMAGLLHPLTGADHVLAMLAIGMWAALQSRLLSLAVPASFLLMLLGGFLLARMGIALPPVETGISLSVLLLGLLIASAARLPAVLSVALAGGFALFHGYAHGVEASGSLLGFATGFLVASLSLHVAGGVLATRVQAWIPALTRGLGAMIAAGGALMMC